MHQLFNALSEASSRKILMEPTSLESAEIQTIASGERGGTQTILVVGIGSAHGDDQIGWLVAKELMRRSIENCRVRIAATPLELLNWLEDCTLLHVIDACQGTGPPGTIYRLPWPCSEMEQREWSGTHDFHLASVLRLAQQLEQLPSRVVVWGIEMPGTHTRLDAPSNEIIDWILPIADRIQAAIVDSELLVRQQDGKEQS
jgi:hydrogenase maturation protease